MLKLFFKRIKLVFLKVIVRILVHLFRNVFNGFDSAVFALAASNFWQEED